MSAPPGATTTTNSATNANVGAQAGTIHGGVHNYYQVPKDATPEQKFGFALTYLRSGQPTTARKLMDDVVMAVDDSDEMWFYWLLAFFSGRTLWELSVEDRGRLAVAFKDVDRLKPGAWTPGIEMIRRVVLASRSPDEVTTAIAEDLDRLDPVMADGILRHLERVLSGSLKDELWHRDVEQAEAGQRVNRRAARVWKFFEADPAPPRTRPVPPVTVTGSQRALAVLTIVPFAGAVCTIGWLVLQGGHTSTVMAFVIALVGAGVALVNGAEWRFRDERLRAKERELHGRLLFSDLAAAGGFADKVDRLYARYYRKFAPRGDTRADWGIAAYGPLCAFREELTEVYRESRIRAEEVKWLIRFQVRELRRQWQLGTLVDHRRRWATPGPVKVATVLGSMVAAAATMWAIQGAVRQDGLVAACAVLLAVPAGGAAAAVLLRIMADYKRVAVDQLDRDQRMAAYRHEYRRWQQVLADRPDDGEMANWLDCDRRILLQYAMRAYRLKWSDVSAYASLEAQGKPSHKARAKNGPWRYSRYELLVFLLTPDGVRQITVELDFAKASFHVWQRTNYRYDAVAAVRVTERDGAREFRLSLVNGTDIEVAVTEPDQAGEDEDARILADGAQDATGLRNTLFVLEGVAAEGRSWWAGPAYQRAG